MLSKIKIYGDLADFIGHKELEAVINSSADAIRFLVTNFKGLELYMSDKHYKVLVNSTEINQDELHNPVGSSEVSIVPVISGSGGAARAILGIGLIAVSFGAFGAFGAKSILGAGFSGATFGAKAAFSVGALLTLGAVSDMLFPTPEIPDFQNEEDPRVSFSFSGIQNVTRAGTSHPIVYGEIVTGSVVISAGIDTNQVTA